MSDLGSQKNGSILPFDPTRIAKQRAKNGTGRRNRRPAPKNTHEEILLDERMRQVFLLVVAESRSISDIQNGTQKPWRSNARRAVELKMAGYSADQIDAILTAEFRAWIHDCLCRSDLKPAA